MLELIEIKKLLADALTLEELHVTFDGSQCKVIAISDMFIDMSRVKRQQAVYAPLAQVISENKIHAVIIKTFSKEQWQRDKLFNL